MSYVDRLWYWSRIPPNFPNGGKAMAPSQKIDAREQNHVCPVYILTLLRWLVLSQGSHREGTNNLGDEFVENRTPTEGILTMVAPR
jgi:hypothetical protein